MEATTYKPGSQELIRSSWPVATTADEIAISYQPFVAGSSPAAATKDWLKQAKFQGFSERKGLRKPFAPQPFPQPPLA
jgi:hypothetical protein